MRLKKLELIGFKSFADKTEILFDQGVTCVVGPNGCGKSNISDSIRWVLGERSAKLLRGSKMEDVIFNGTDFRKAIAMAEVSLTIDNADRGLPIDYNEVTITRRLYRSGDSEYLINKTLCRLKDIQDLILDTGIGSSSYSMIEQGRIDYILNADADERRFLIEEAAGISKYKVKKEEAIRKLERTEENRLRLNDIIHEVHKNIQYAERQARRAERYKEEFERLKKLEIKKALKDIAQIHNQKDQLQAEQTRLQEAQTQAENKVAELRRAQEALNESLREITARYHKAESERFVIQSKYEQNQQQMKFNQEKRVEIANRQGQIEQELQELRARIQQSAQEILEKNQEISSIQEKKQQAETDLHDSETQLKSIESKLAEIKQQLDQFKTQSFEAAAHNSRLRNDLHKLLAFLETAEQQKLKQNAGTHRLQEEASSWLSKKESTAGEILSLESKLDLLTAQKSESDERIRFFESETAKLKESEEAAERSLHEKETRLKMLQEIESSARANEDALLEPSDHFTRDLVSTLREVFSVTPGYEWALESALAHFSKSLIAHDLTTAESLLDRIREKKAFATGLFVLPSTSSFSRETTHLNHPKIKADLKSVVTVKENFEHLFRPFLENTYLVEDLAPSEFLREFHGLSSENRFLSPNGISLGFEGKIYYRNTNLLSEENSFNRAAEISSLEQQISHLEESLAQTRSGLSQLKSDLQQGLETQETLAGSVLESKLQKEALESLRQNIEDRLHSYRKELELLDFEFKDLLTRENDVLTRKTDLELLLLKSDEEEKSIRLHQDALAHELGRLDLERSSALQTFAEHKAKFSHFEERTRLLTQSVEIMADHHARNENRVKDLDHEGELLRQRQNQLAEDDIQTEQDQAKLEESRREADIASELIRQEKEKEEGIFASLQDEFIAASQKQQELQNSMHQYEMKFMDLGYQEKNIAERLQQSYRLQLSEVNPEDYPAEDASDEDLAQEVEELKRKVEALGTVNLLAIEEYEELKQRYEFLMTQQKDLDDAKEQLMETIRKINRTTKGLFEETFTNVQNQFQEYYQTLFRGGHAQLVLVDESNPLESGIDIVVRPPGKKPQHISLLSGGEKALTAIALLFALFKIKPSPFCVLDEVDAPLDEANVDRFLTVLKTFLQTSQFIIVTHNRKTIAMGDSLYGVTMQEAGVSKLVSVRVSKDKDAKSPVDILEGKPSETEQVNA